MEYLIFNEKTGLRQSTRGDFQVEQGDLTCNTDDRLWFKRMGQEDSMIWTAIDPKDLPARLRTEALILGITL